MIPSILAHEVSQSLKSFITTGFESSSPFFSGMFSRFVNTPGQMIKGPYLSLSLPFQAGTFSDDFFTGFKTDYPPYLHQQQAWERLSSNKKASSALIATGTGSGKTECFMYPILDHCIRDTGKGIKAIIIYPMNALATDQAKRFAKTIFSEEKLKGKVRVGLFVGGDDETLETMGPNMVITDKTKMRENPPDILLTNYKMLDLLLMRSSDRKLWRNNQPNTLRYLVVDELHTFDGAQGTDLACLIRRLKARLDCKRDDLICAGTSATLGSGSEQVALTEYAAQIFQTEFDNQSIVGESRQDVGSFLAGNPIRYNFAQHNELEKILNPDNYRSINDYLISQYELLFPDSSQARPTDQAWRSELGESLKQHLLFYNLLQLLDKQPRSFEELTLEFTKVLPLGSRKSAIPILNSLCALISCARNPKISGLPLVNLRMQLWVRELRRMVTPLKQNLNDKGEYLPFELTFSDDHKKNTGQLFLPLIHCNHCNASAWAAVKSKEKSQVHTDLRSIYNHFFNHNPDLITLFPLLAGEKEPAVDGHIHNLCSGCGNLQWVGDQCQACGDEELHRVFVPSNVKERRRGGVPKLVAEHNCPRCGSDNSLMVFGARAATVSSVAVHQSYATPYNDDKKLIAFSDGVQDATHRAGFFSARTWQHNIRMAIAQAVPEQGCSLNRFYDWLPEFWLDSTVNTKAMDKVRFICEFIAPNMQYYTDYISLTEKGSLSKDTQLIHDISQRLQFEVLAEFGYRSRIGRSLVKTSTVAMGFEMDSITASANELLVVISEKLGVTDVMIEEVTHFLLGLLFHLKERGAIYHQFLDAYIHNGGKNFLLTRLSFLPSFAPQSRAPIFLTSAKKHAEFDCLLSESKKTWYHHWVYQALGNDRLLESKFEKALYPLVIDTLVSKGVLLSFEVRDDSVWAINPNILKLSTDTVSLLTEKQQDKLIVPREMARFVEGMASLLLSDDSCYVCTENTEHWLSRLYLSGDIHRVIGEEHTGLLERSKREKVENNFINSDEKPWYPNLLSATPTLEMGIDIGDLSSVLLCSVPPAQANYLQRIGRAGRRDGNAFNMTVAEGSPHDLFFYSEPLEMMAGKVEPPGVFLNASAVISRQLTAFCFDRWVATGIDDSAIPKSLKPVLNNVENSELKLFPYNFTTFVKANAPELLEDFYTLFAGEFTERTRDFLARFIYDDGDFDGVEQRIIKRLFDLVKERKNLVDNIGALQRLITKLQKLPDDEANREQIDSAQIERGGLQAILREINAKKTLNFFTDEGLIPNYSFPEAGVILRSVIYRKKAIAVPGESAYENKIFEYERPGYAAISELAPENSFYAGGRKVTVKQVDLKLSDIEYWRFCPSCSYTSLDSAASVDGDCPRCNDPMWSDTGQRAAMLRMRQVMANTSDRDSRIGDDSEDREPTFYTKQLLTDFDRSNVEVAFQVENDELPFGFEFIRKVSFREINFGEYSNDSEETLIAGESKPRIGFKLCKQCGMVQEKRSQEQVHAFTCSLKDKTDETNLAQCLYLYREFNSEALRILLPIVTVEGGDRYLNSFIAALQLGLKKRFGGQVDHLKVMTYDEPIAESDAKRRFLMLYDSVPGGTGYLHELMRSPDDLLNVFKSARDVMVKCTCNQEIGKDGCYRCLYAYRNSHGMESTSRDTAVALFNRILDVRDFFKESKSIDSIVVNPILDSELESRFIHALKRSALQGRDLQVLQQVVNGKPGFYLKVGGHSYTIEPQVLLGDKQGVSYASKPDFMIQSTRTSDSFKPIALFMDGYQYHKDIAGEDSAKRTAIVQSGRYHVWSLTWQDVNEQFTKSKMEIRNPFTEQLQAKMQPLQKQLTDIFELGGLRRIPVLSPLDQLLDYLSEPNEVNWRNVAFVHALGWFDQENMLDTTSVGKLIDNFKASCSTLIGQELDNLNSSVAVGGLSLSSINDPLTVMCVLPTEALESKKTELMFVNLFLDTSVSLDVKLNQQAWFGFIRLYNLYQFLPLTSFISQDGLKAGLYESIQYNYLFGDSQTRATTHNNNQLLSLFDETIEELKEGLKLMVEKNLTLPDVLYELQKEDGEIIAEAELVWHNEKLVGLLEEQLIYTNIFENAGWKVLKLDEQSQWVSQAEQYL